MSEHIVLSAEAMVSPYREAAGAALSLVEAAMTHGEALGVEVNWLGSQCESDLKVMIAGVRQDSAVAGMANVTRARHREEERALDIRLTELEDENGRAVDRAQSHATRERAVLARAEVQCRVVQRAVASLSGAGSATEALGVRAVVATDAAAAATDRIRALIRHQGDA